MKISLVSNGDIVEKHLLILRRKSKYKYTLKVNLEYNFIKNCKYEYWPQSGHIKVRKLFHLKCFCCPLKFDWYEFIKHWIERFSFYISICYISILYNLSFPWHELPFCKYCLAFKEEIPLCWDKQFVLQSTENVAEILTFIRNFHQFDRAVQKWYKMQN